MPDTGKIALMRQFTLGRQRGIARRYSGIVPQKLEHGDHPFVGKEAALSKQPCTVRIFETVDRIADNRRVLQVENWIFIVSLARRSTVGQQLIQVSVADV